MPVPAFYPPFMAKVCCSWCHYCFLYLAHGLQLYLAGKTPPDVHGSRREIGRRHHETRWFGPNSGCCKHLAAPYGTILDASSFPPVKPVATAIVPGSKILGLGFTLFLAECGASWSS